MVVTTVDVYGGIASWTFCSIGMMVFNKQAVTVFPFGCGLVGVQLFAGALAMLVCCWKSLHVGSMRDLLRWCLVVPFFTGMLLTSVLALKDASMTAVVTFRALSPLVALSVERFYPNPITISPSMLGSLGFVLTGCVIFVKGMSSGDTAGLGWIALNTFFALGDRLLQRLMLASDQDPVDISKTGVTFLNNALGMIPLVVAAYLVGEFETLPGAVAHMDMEAILWVAGSCVAGVGISYTGIVVQSMISATSFLVLVTASKFVIVLIDVLVIGTKTLTAVQVAGALITILGSIAYGYVRVAMEAAQEKLDKCDPEQAKECEQECERTILMPRGR